MDILRDAPTVPFEKEKTCDLDVPFVGSVGPFFQASTQMERSVVGDGLVDGSQKHVTMFLLDRGTTEFCFAREFLTFFDLISF